MLKNKYILHTTDYYPTGVKRYKIFTRRGRPRVPTTNETQMSMQNGRRTELSDTPPFRPHPDPLRRKRSSPWAERKTLRPLPDLRSHWRVFRTEGLRGRPSLRKNGARDPNFVGPKENHSPTTESSTLDSSRWMCGGTGCESNFSKDSAERTYN